MERDGHIHVLPPEVAHKIAAGEVVDRPCALVRELLDNAIDSGATSIEVALEGGGIRRTEVSDNGRGMERDDLALCHLSHATSKILHEDDLLSIGTLGFRGEALCAISAVARLEITSSTSGGEAWKLTAGPGLGGGSAGSAALPSASGGELGPAHRAKGTTVRVSGLFDNLPARKKFLKREGSEALQGRAEFIEKALAWPALSFRFSVDGELRLFLPAAATRKERFSAALGLDPSFLHEVHASGDGFTVTVVVGGTELHRADRRLQYVIANGRRIDEFGLQQALEYGTQGAFPNGSHPLGAVFIDVDPARADFNIHPAKREARFHDGAAIHRAVTASLREYFQRHVLISGARFERPVPEEDTVQRELSNEGGFSPVAGPPRTTDHGFMDRPDGGLYARTQDLAAAALLQAADGERSPIIDRGTPEAPQRMPEKPVRYLGRAFGLFLIAERGESLYLIDQHAAHERIIFDSLSVRPPTRQELLVPYPFETPGEEDDDFLRSRQAELQSLGIGLSDEGQGRWQITALPEYWRDADSSTVQSILDLREAGESIGERWRATMACKRAAKDGDYLDADAARSLVEKALSLPIPRCPHGRPVWMELRRDDLLRAVRRLE